MQDNTHISVVNNTAWSRIILPRLSRDTCLNERTDIQIPMCNNAPQKCGSRSPKEGYSQAGRGEAFLYAESADGIKWTKPVRAALFLAFSQV